MEDASSGGPPTRPWEPDAHFRVLHVVWLRPVGCAGLVRQAYAWSARNRETHRFSVLGDAPPIRGITLPTFLPESG